MIGPKTGEAYKTSFMILVNQQGDFLVNGEFATLDQLLFSFEGAIEKKTEEDYPLVVVLDWRHCPSEVMDSLLSGLIERYWYSMEKEAWRRGGAHLCDLSEEQVKSFFAEYEFQIRLLPTYPPLPSPAKYIDAPTIFIEKDAPSRDSLD